MLLKSVGVLPWHGRSALYHSVASIDRPGYKAQTGTLILCGHLLAT